VTAALPEVGQVTSVYHAKPDPNAADPPSLLPSSRCCDDHLSPPYNWALAEIAGYFENQPVPQSEEGRRFDVLADLIEAYKARAWPVEVVS
jgi:hypothetical protein